MNTIAQRQIEPFEISLVGQFLLFRSRRYQKITPAGYILGALFRVKKEIRVQTLQSQEPGRIPKSASSRSRTYNPMQEEKSCLLVICCCLNWMKK